MGTKDYLFTDEWEYPGHSGCKWNTELKRGGVSIWNWVGDYSFVNNANKFEIMTTTPGWETTSFPGRESLRRFLALSTRSNGPVTVRLPRDSFAGFPQWRPMWLPVSTSGT